MKPHIQESRGGELSPGHAPAPDRGRFSPLGLRERMLYFLLVFLPEPHGGWYR